MGPEHREALNEEATSQEIADYCRSKLPAEICDSIACIEDPDDALGLACGELQSIGVDPDVFFGGATDLIEDFTIPGGE